MIQHQQQRHSRQQQQPEQRQFQFDQIFVVKSSSSSNTNNSINNFANASSVVPAVLVYERKYIYAGTNANWKLNFKDLFQVKVDLTTTTTTTTTSSNDQQRSQHHHHRSGSSNRGGGNNRGDEVLTLTLSGRKISLKCIARMNSNSSSSINISYNRGRGGGGNAADRQHQLEEFIEGLKSVHRRMTSKQMKQDVDDAYDAKYYTDGRKMMGNDASYHRGGLTQSTSSFRQQRQQNQHHQQLQARKRAPVVTPAQYTNHKSQSLYLPAGGEKKHPTSGAFQSPAKPHVTAKSSLSSSMRHADVGSSMRRNNNDGGYAHYDPAMDVEEMEADFPDEYDAKPESSVVITGNVVPSPSAVRKLNLPSRSPRNASPVKIRKTMSKLPNRRLEVVGGSGRQLHGISGGDIRLRDRNGMMMSTKSTSRRMEDEFEFRDDDEGESEDERARQRLQKGRINDDDDEEEDYGFDVGGFDDDDDGEVRSKCKKRLRMSIADDDDDDKDEEEIVKPRGNTKLRLSIDDDDMDDDGDDVVKSTGEVSRTKDKFETTQDASEATVDVALSSEEIQAHKKAALANFFAPKANSAEGTFDKSKKEAIAKLFATKTKSGEGAEDKSDAALDASDDLDETATKATVDEPALSSEEKQARKASFFAPRTKSAKPKSETNGALLLSTPSKKVPSGMGEDRSATPPHSSITPVPMLTQRKSSKYFSNINVKQNRPSSPPPRFQNYSSEEGEGEDEQEEEEPQYQTTRDRLQSTFPSRRNTYGRKGLGLGQSRLGNRLDNRGPFDFDRYKASSSPSNSVQRNPYFNSKTISPSGLASPSKADLALGSGRKSTTGGRGIFIRPSNYEKEPPAKVPPQTAIPGIQNLGNTCYLSASLQTLFGIPSFVTDLYRTYAEARSANTSGDDETMPLTRALLEVAVVIGVLAEEDASCIRPEAAKPNKFSSSLAANPSALKKQMDVLTDKFAGYEQRDAHEFLSDLVDFLHDELTASKSTPSLPPRGENEVGATAPSDQERGRLSPNENRHPNEVVGIAGAGKSSTIKHYFASTSTTAKRNHEHLPTDEYFQLNVRVCLECDSCGYSRSKDEMYRHLSVDVGDDSEQDTWTVEKGLQQFFQPEKREVKCEKCQSGTTATQTLEVLSRPKALLLHFKRFIVTQEQKAGPLVQNDDGTSAPPIMEMVLRKNKAKIRLEETLSISPYGGNSNQILPRKYHLRGVVHHIGNTAFSGHYTSCAKRILKDTQGDSSDTFNAQDNEEQWVLFDDRVGTRRPADYVLENERNQRNCYMALYELN